MIKVRHKHGHLATDAQILAVIDLARATRMDEAWFGEIVKAKARDGNIVHVVKDCSYNKYITLKYAVKLLDEGIAHVRDYLDADGALEFESLMHKVGLVTPEMDQQWFWTGRFVSKSKAPLVTLVNAVFDNDVKLARYRPIKVLVHKKSGLYFTDLGGNWDWQHSLVKWFCSQDKYVDKIAYDVWGQNGYKDKYYNFWHCGKGNGIISLSDEMKHSPSSPEDILYGHM